MDPVSLCYLSFGLYTNQCDLPVSVLTIKCKESLPINFCSHYKKVDPRLSCGRVISDSIKMIFPAVSPLAYEHIFFLSSKDRYDMIFYSQVKFP